MIIIPPLPYRSTMDTPEGARQWIAAFDSWKRLLSDNLNLIPQFVSVTDIDNPVELSNYSGSQTGTLLIAYQTDAGVDYVTVYVYDNTATDNSPYVVSGWVAISGRYSKRTIRIGELTVSRLAKSDADKGISSADLSDFVAGASGRVSVSDDGLGGVIINITESGIDHNSLANLASGDVHTQYLNTTRGDSRYLAEYHVQLYSA